MSAIARLQQVFLKADENAILLCPHGGSLLPFNPFVNRWLNGGGSRLVLETLLFTWFLLGDSIAVAKSPLHSLYESLSSNEAIVEVAHVAMCGHNNAKAPNRSC